MRNSPNRRERKSVPKTQKVSREWRGDTVRSMSKSQKSVLGAWGVIISCIALYLCLDLIFASGEDAQDATAQAIEEVAGQEVEDDSMVGFKDVIQGKWSR